MCLSYRFGEYEPASLEEHLTEMCVNESSRSVELSRSQGDVTSSMASSQAAHRRKRTIGVVIFTMIVLTIWFFY